MLRHRVYVPCIYLAPAFSLCLFAASALAGADSRVEQGRQLALAECQACHFFPDTEQAGNVAPPFVGMKARFLDRSKLYNIIYDPSAVIKPHTMMPPFGRNELLDKAQINLIIDYLYTL